MSTPQPVPPTQPAPPPPTQRRLIRAFALLCAVASIAGAGAYVASTAEATDDVIEIQNGNWSCTTPQDHSVVIVHNAVANNDPTQPRDAVALQNGCTGVIDSITVLHGKQDMVRINNGAHDLVINSATLHCSPPDPGFHQDGIQALGGARITIRNANVDCPQGNNGGIYFQGSDKSQFPATDVVCVNCEMRNANASVVIGVGVVRSGASYGLFHRGTGSSAPADCTRVDPGAVDPVLNDNVCLAN